MIGTRNSDLEPLPHVICGKDIPTAWSQPSGLFYDESENLRGNYIEAEHRFANLENRFQAFDYQDEDGLFSCCVKDAAKTNVHVFQTGIYTTRSRAQDELRTWYQDNPAYKKEQEIPLKTWYSKADINARV